MMLRDTVNGSTSCILLGQPPHKEKKKIPPFVAFPIISCSFHIPTLFLATTQIFLSFFSLSHPSVNSPLPLNSSPNQFLHPLAWSSLLKWFKEEVKKKKPPSSLYLPLHPELPCKPPFPPPPTQIFVFLFFSACFIFLSFMSHRCMQLLNPKYLTWISVLLAFLPGSNVRTWIYRPTLCLIWVTAISQMHVYSGRGKRGGSSDKDCSLITKLTSTVQTFPQHVFFLISYMIFFNHKI